MQKFICLQSGHQGTTTGATGAPGEQELNVRVRDRLGQILISKGFMVQLVNADPPQAEINKNFDLFLALHGDADIYGVGGGCISAADPDYDENYIESNRICNAIESEYFSRSGISNVPSRINVNMTRYYMWLRLTGKTPCVILEMGVVQDEHDKVILADTERVATAIARGICKSFGVSYDQTAPKPPTEPTTIIKTAELEALKKKIDELTARIDVLQTGIALLKSECEGRIALQRKEMVQKVIDLASKL